jgi:hypothetical protein
MRTNLPQSQNHQYNGLFGDFVDLIALKIAKKIMLNRCVENKYFCRLLCDPHPCFGVLAGLYFLLTLFAITTAF